MSAPSDRHVLFATYSQQPDLTADDRLLAAALKRRGVDVRAAPWDALTDWRAAAVIVRSTWDYYLRRREFLDWTNEIAAHTALYNTPAVIRWNSHKAYLAELAERGIPVIDTVFAAAGVRVDLANVASAHGWDDVVIKPAVSAAAYETRRFRTTERRAAQAHLDRLLVMGDVMMQPHLSALGERGELSVMFIRGAFTHAVRRRSALIDEGAMPISAPADATSAAVRFGERALSLTPGAAGSDTPPLYARVDLAELADGDFQLLELELIEPSLFFVHAPKAAERMAEAIIEVLS